MVSTLLNLVRVELDHVFPMAHPDLIWLFQISHRDSLPAAIWPQYVRESAEKHFHIFLDGIASPLTESIVPLLLDCLLLSLDLSFISVELLEVFASRSEFRGLLGHCFFNFRDRWREMNASKVAKSSVQQILDITLSLWGGKASTTRFTEEVCFIHRFGWLPWRRSHWLPRCLHRERGFTVTSCFG